MRWFVALFMIAVAACAHSLPLLASSGAVIDARSLLAGEASGASQNQVPTLAVEILITGEDVLETMLRFREHSSGDVTVEVAQADGLPLWQQATTRANNEDFRIKRWTIYDRRAARQQLAKFRKVRVALAPDPALVLHGVKVAVTAESGISSVSIIVFLNHPDGSARSGPIGRTTAAVGEWVMETLSAFKMRAALSK